MGTGTGRGVTGSSAREGPEGGPEEGARRPAAPPPLSSRHYLNINNDSLGPAAAAAAANLPPAISPAAKRAQRHAALAQTLVQFVARLPPPSPGSPAEALRTRLGARLGVPALGEWIGDFTAVLAADAAGQAAAAGRPDADLPDQPLEELEHAVERLLSSQPQLLAHDSAVLVARLRGLAGLLELQVLQRGWAPGQGPSGGGPGGPAGPTALDLALQRPALLLADLPTLERRLAALQAALRLPDRAAAVAAAVQQPVWLYTDLPSPSPPPI
ncbi:hypothetical protein HXX76_006172 [Chlamydomonas incerta]|uniref:Uncharacterized protein n=1 Tax=Chlamydomonas incerta TaxID=51695 RepID=A0A835T0M3_CHLIN|nr:hypothetical protein HXX76_006172 [Chlamydomonas incerta]|eukprot:KAG2436644.1 hypothetical protein HXX76_006172 [Chlamydomonas incerta]